LNRLTNLATNLVPVVPGVVACFVTRCSMGWFTTAILLGAQAAFAANRLALAVMARTKFQATPLSSRTA
jgi:hypothetical protein